MKMTRDIGDSIMPATGLANSPSPEGGDSEAIEMAMIQNNPYCKSFSYQQRATRSYFVMLQLPKSF